MEYRFVSTTTLEISYLEWNPGGDRTAVLVHGWPDCPEGWRKVADLLVQAGYRVICPALRGFGRTRFLSEATPRSGQLAALGRDLLEFLDALNVKAPVIVGQDWGARAAANACGLRADVASHLVMLAVGYGTNVPQQTLTYAQARNYWYHWFIATPRGQKAIEEDRRGFAKLMWDTWSPPGWYSQQAFDEACLAFENPDWARIVVSSCRHRWGLAEGDPSYEADEAKLNPPPTLAVPTLVLHGAADTVNHPDTSAGKEHFFTGPYRRTILDNVGHFPHREEADAVATAILSFVKENEGIRI
ncbi:Pimeloyl-ACP methyl ester carboxylesterase [Burkholderia sp. YR290]|nr:Pimeloyl-ACP methyl ester carboxylesterase [Burkholderia sp. YR290]